MATVLLNSLGGGIIWVGSGAEAYRKRGAEVVRSVARTPDTRGVVGSDRLGEMQFDGIDEPLWPIRNERGQLLRFALLALDVDRLRAKVRNQEELRIVTSYPNAAERMFRDAQIVYVSGGVEAELVDRACAIDAAYELVQSGDSVRENGLEIVEDAIESVELRYISLNLANNR